MYGCEKLFLQDMLLWDLVGGLMLTMAKLGPRFRKDKYYLRCHYSLIVYNDRLARS
jgi:hypothetical protein